MIHHVTLETRREDVEDAVAFWALLGFERVPAPGRLAAIATWVQREGTQVHLLYADEPVVAPAGHVAVVAPDGYEETVRRLEDAGFACEPTTADWGSPRCFARSPGGHRVEVMAFAPGG
jgi:catechol 2,3-dioxygenase-like lactoylglutathione lyase family enzyme